MSDPIWQPDANDRIVIEAENLNRTPGDRIRWIEKSDFGTPSGSYMTPTWRTMVRKQAGLLWARFNVATPQTYQFLFRCHTFGPTHGAWFWFDVDGNQRYFGPRSNGALVFRGTDFTWGNGTDTYGGRLRNTIPATMELSTGTHQLNITSIGGHMKVDRIAIIPVGDTIITHGSTAAGPAESTKDSGVIPAEPDYYQQWLLNPLNNGSRILLIELDHADGTVYLASEARNDDYHNAYDDWLTGEPEMISDLTGLGSLGDIAAVNPNRSENWLNLHFRGYPCRWFFGDKSWAKNRFRQIASATIDAVRYTDEREYQFDLVGDVERFNRVFYTGADAQKDLDFHDAVDWLLGYHTESVTPNFLNLDSDDFSTPMLFTVTESSNMLSVLKTLAYGVGAFVRISQNGELDIIKPDTDYDPTFTLTVDDIAAGGLRMVDTVPPVAKILLTYNDGASTVSADTVAVTGRYSETLEVETYLKNSADATARANEIAAERGKKRNVWEIDIIGSGDFIIEGDYISVEHDDLNGAGVVQLVKRRPLSQLSTAEVLI